jgi:hypothetical protein
MLGDGTVARQRECSLTTPHKLQGRGALGKPALTGWVVCDCRNPMAALCLLHAVVRQHADASGCVARWGIGPVQSQSCPNTSRMLFGSRMDKSRIP